MIIDRRKSYQPYFLAYINKNNIKDGETISNYEFINWIIDKHGEFREKTGIDKNDNNYAEKLIDWLNEEEQ